MKVLSLNYSDISGGAARAAYRIHHALRANNVDSRMLVVNSIANDWTVERYGKNFLARSISKIGVALTSLLVGTLKTGNPIIHSPAILPSNLSRQLNDSNVDIVHLHWINHEMMSISDIGKIKKPAVWTLHDMWPFCGAEHYCEDFRWRDGYNACNRPDHEAGLDLNRLTWLRKRKKWQNSIQLVSPSSWLADCAKQSVLMRDWPIAVIPNPIDTELWSPVEKQIARRILKLPLDVPLVLFGASGGISDPRKGFSILENALSLLSGELVGAELVIFGQLRPQFQSDYGFPVHYTGHLYDDISLRLLYSAADVMVVPSKQEAFGQTASESHACGTPVVAFSATGLSDIVEHAKTGYLARPFDPVDLAHGIKWVLGDGQRHQILSQAARQRALKLWSYNSVSAQYLNVYKSTLEVNG